MTLKRASALYGFKLRTLQSAAHSGKLVATQDPVTGWYDVTVEALAEWSGLFLVPEECVKAEGIR